MIVLKNCRIFDGKSPSLQTGLCIVIEGEKITDICPEKVEFSNAKLIDLNGASVFPGFTDCHMHMLLDEVPADKNRCLTSASAGGELYPNADSATAYLGVDNCRKMIRAGFTSVMDGGGRNFVDCALREAIQKDYVIGPNYYISAKQLTTNKAHFVGFSLEPAGPYAMRKAVRDLVWWGVDYVKMQLSPPIRIIGRSSDYADFTSEEIEAAIDEAHNYGLPVHAHLRGPEAIKKFLRAGGDVVVHGTGIDDDGIEMMLKENKVLLPTLLSPSPTPSKEMLAAKPQAVIDMLAKTAKQHWASARRAYEAGVTIAFSTDCGTLGNHIGTNAKEFENLVSIGMTPLEAVKSATLTAATVTGQEDRGRIQKGYKADLTVIEGNPTENIRDVYNVKMTIVNGKIVYDRQSITMI